MIFFLYHEKTIVAVSSIFSQKQICSSPSSRHFFSNDQVNITVLCLRNPNYVILSRKGFMDNINYFIAEMFKNTFCFRHFLLDFFSGKNTVKSSFHRGESVEKQFHGFRKHCIKPSMPALQSVKVSCEKDSLKVTA